MYYEELAHENMEAENFHDLIFMNCRPRKASDVNMKAYES